MLVNLFSNKVYEFARINGDISGNDCFVITIPDLEEIDNSRNTRVIDSKKLKLIKDFITLNMNVIDDFYDDLLSDDEFILNLKPLEIL